jgi:hypothetical protein
LRNLPQSLHGDRPGGNEEDMEPNKLEFDPRVAKIRKLADMNRVMGIILQKPNGTFTSLMESPLKLVIYQQMHCLLHLERFNFTQEIT